MTDNAGTRPDASYQAKPPLSAIVRSVLRAVGSTAAVVAIYYLLPLDHSSAGFDITALLAGLVAFIVLVTFQIRWIITSRWPALRALEALGISVPFFLLLFASAYVVMAALSAGNFSAPMTHTNGLYFSVTVFATVGFGDITAKTEVARLVVTVQMMIDLVILGLGARVILGAVTRGRERRTGSI
jgi:voltage-gated potassium channel